MIASVRCAPFIIVLSGTLSIPVQVTAQAAREADTVVVSRMRGDRIKDKLLDFEWLDADRVKLLGDVADLAPAQRRDMIFSWHKRHQAALAEQHNLQVQLTQLRSTDN